MECVRPLGLGALPRWDGGVILHPSQPVATLALPACACAGRESSSGREGAKVSERIKVETTANCGRCYGLDGSMRAYIDRGTQAPSSKLHPPNSSN